MNSGNRRLKSDAFRYPSEYGRKEEVDDRGGPRLPPQLKQNFDDNNNVKLRALNLLLSASAISAVMAAGPVGTLNTSIEAPVTEVGDVDAVFLYEATRVSRDLKWRYQSARTRGAQDPLRFNQIFDLYAASFGQEPREGAGEIIPRAKNVEEFHQLLKSRGALLSVEDRLLLLSMIGYRLARGYDRDFNPEKSLAATDESIYKNAQAGMTHGGQCGEIASFIAESSKILGFDHVGLHSLVQEKGGIGSGEGEGHTVAHFRDGSTGHYYAQNYGQVLDTGATTLADAVDASTRFYGIFTDVSWVESRPGHITMYRPSDSRWLDREVNHAAELNPKWSLLSASVSNEERYVLAQARLGSGAAISKAFLLHSDRDGPGGKYQVDAIGVAAGAGRAVAMHNSVFDEMGGAASMQAGYLRYLNPSYLAGYPGHEAGGADNSPFAGVRVSGLARIDRWTGQISMEARSLELQPGTFGFTPSGWWNETLLGAFRELPKGLGWMGFERAFNVRPDNLVHQDWAPRTAYDRLSVVLDSRGAAKNQAR
ncbi:MAG: hypothetical protein AAB425_14600, partial [Bdellovibrionota bacterium]